MKALLTRLLSLRLERYNSATGRRRRGGAVFAAGLVVALFAGSGIAVAAAGTVSAHTPNVSFDCTGVTFDGTNYQPGNTLTVTIVGGNSDGTDQVQTRAFDYSIKEFFAFPDATQAWDFTVAVDAPDGKDATEWDYTESNQSTACVVPSISIDASACQAAGDLTTIDATLGTLDPARAYVVRLTGTNGYDSGNQPVQTSSYQWTGLAPGYDYKATLTDTGSGLSSSSSAYAVGCPQPPDFQVSAQQCSAEGGSGSFDVTVLDLVPGRDYVLALINRSGGVPTEIAFTASASSYTTSFPTLAGGTYYVTATDVADGTSRSSADQVYLPCPGMPVPKLEQTECTATGQSNASITASVEGLIPGRSYTISIGSGGNVLFTKALSPATTSTWSESFSNVPPGEYAMSVVDTTDPNVTGFAACARTTLADCPSQQEIALEAQQCSVPGGSGSIQATVTNFTVGRNYIVTLTQNGLPVPGQPVSENFDPVDNSPAIFIYQDLKPGLAYQVVVQDVTGQAQNLPIAGCEMVLKDCPGNPELVLVQPQCTVLTVSTITVDVSKLLPGETYTVSVTTSKDGKPVAGVPDQQVSGVNPTSSLQFSGLPVGANYTVTIANATKTLVASGQILLILCDLPTLAYTGASTMTPTLAGLGFLQFGLVLVGISLVKRRSGAREV